MQCHYCSHAYAGTARAVGYNPLMTSYPHIEKYHADLERFIEFGGSDNQQSIRRAFAECLDSYCREHRERLALVDELSISASNKPDGTVKDSLRMARGYWEAKDSHDDLDAEIKVKFNRGYPRDNIIFEDSQTAVLVQNGNEAMRVDMSRDGAYPPAPWIPESKVNRFASSNVLFTSAILQHTRRA